ncbi:BZ3500_MvSof-1268-A1-R1_Chr2-1g04280 [Microbotryum saponariae]|uniref:BZ3500_MvSof-1268-A1-R1_Chr2-1g04280 protein n=1 Tax=Microbotryum saponariae TaxID=289078 RepID=A0A2X0KI50_9BASI|nr:BZ3500_MvSof-1268-A1-R1_Chr2-1g04280 [Microbotryum saponariae]SCZ91308.1 BZ3501_MvSof-1269-A2-R1_Chr2-1g03936 [Microbotryum saponariae]
MSSTVPAIDASELAATQTAGYKLDKEDESLAKWKASLGLDANAVASGSAAAGPKVEMISLTLTSNRPAGPIVLDLKDPKQLAGAAPVVIKEGSEYTVEIKFLVKSLVAGLKYIHVAKRMGLSDKLEHMIGSRGPSTDPVVAKLPTEEAPSGMLARGKYVVRSRVIDDDGAVYLDATWQFELKKDW